MPNGQYCVLNTLTNNASRAHPEVNKSGIHKVSNNEPHIVLVIFFLI